MVEEVKRGSSTLERVMHDFRDVTTNGQQFKIYTLLEGLPYPRIGKVRPHQYPSGDEEPISF
jgi:hypothetical protein